MLPTAPVRKGGLAANPPSGCQTIGTQQGPLATSLIACQYTSAPQVPCYLIRASIIYVLTGCKIHHPNRFGHGEAARNARSRFSPGSLTPEKRSQFPAFRAGVESVPQRRRSVAGASVCAAQLHSRPYFHRGMRGRSTPAINCCPRWQCP